MVEQSLGGGQCLLYLQSVIVRYRSAVRLGGLGLFVIALTVLNGCAMRMGNKTIARDRFDYSGAIARSWKEQMLLNMVKLRYQEPPVFLDVAQVVATYTFEASGSISAPDWEGAPSGSAAGISGRWAESPTITYNPLTGEKFIKSLMQPVPPVSLLSLVEAGWPIDTVFAVGVRAINGWRAAASTAVLRSGGDPEYYRLLTLLRDLQLSGTVGLRVEQKDDRQGGTVFFSSRMQDEATAAKSKEVRRLLRLDPDAREFSIAFGSEAKDDKELAFLTRSMLEMLAEAATGVDIPSEDLSAGRAWAGPNVPAGAGTSALLFRVHVESSQEKPPASEAYAAIHYRNHWFWLPDRDLASKRGFGFLMILFTLAESGTTAAPPVLSISKP